MPTDFNEKIHDPAFDLGGRHLVAASAGTGKTYNIQNVFARLVMEKGLRVREILVVTFTEAATQELRDRIRRILQNLRDLFPVLAREAREGLAPPADEDDGRKQARALVGLLPEDAVGRARLAVEAAVLDFDLAEISTIHGFCGRALRTHAFESGFSFAADAPGDVKLGQLYAAARDWWRRTVVRRQGEDYKRYRTLIDVPNPDFSLSKLEEMLKRLAPRHDVELALPPGDLSAAGALLGIAHGLVEERDSREARMARKELDFGDVLLGMRDALRDGEAGEAFARTLRGEYKAVLLDEFQDTDPVQYEIFRRIFFPEPSVKPPVYFVGDPKQAIYAFRGGDIYTYRRAATARGMETDARNHVLSANFRSTEPVVKAVNGLFRDDSPTNPTFGDPTMPYPGDLRAESGKPPFEGDPDGAAFRFVVPDVLERQDQLYDLCADRIAALLSDDRPVLRKSDKDEARRVKPGDIAILVMANETGKAIRDRLRRRGIPAVVRGADSVFASGEYKDLSVLLSAMAEPGNAQAVRTALLTPFFFLPPARLADLAADRTLPAGLFPALEAAGAGAGMPDFLQLFRELNVRWAEHGFVAAFDLLEKKVSFRVRLAALADGERRLTNLLHLAELIQKAAADVGSAPAAQRDWFVHEARALEDKEAEIRLETDAAAVQIMTIHKSKGLEFPIVVLPDVWKKRQPETPCFFHRQQDAAPAEGEVEPAWSLCATINQKQPDVGAAEHEGEAERMRLLYVALTRASHYGLVFATGRTMVRKSHWNKHSNAFGKIFDRADGGRAEGVVVEHLDTRPEDVVRVNGPRPDDPAALAAAASEPPAVPRPLGRTSFTRLAPDAAPDPFSPDARTSRRNDDDNETGDRDAGDAGSAAAGSDGIFDFPAGDVTGTCWHKIFEVVPYDRTGDALRDDIRARLEDGRLLDRLPEETRRLRVDAAFQMARRTFDLPLAAPDGSTFRLRDIPASDRLAEWNFDFSSRTAGRDTSAIVEVLRKHWGGEPEGSPHRRFLAAAEGWSAPIAKGFLDGSVDLFFRHGGAYYVIDWKSNILGGTAESFTQDRLVGEMASRFYFAQYLIYAAAVHRYLGETLPDYEWTRHFGGVFYVFLRGVAVNRGNDAVFADRPTPELLDDLARVLGL